MVLIMVLRGIHIIAGMLWASAAILYVTHIKPSVQLIGPAGPQFMQAYVGRRKYPQFMMITSTLTVAAGLSLYWLRSGGFTSNWIYSGPGLGYTIGSLAGLASFILGIVFLGPRAAKLGKLGQAVANSGGPPTPEQGSQMHKLEQEMARLELVEFGLLLISLVTMATARYWSF